jgi:hypothetical protein
VPAGISFAAVMVTVDELLFCRVTQDCAQNPFVARVIVRADTNRIRLAAMLFSMCVDHHK